MTHMIATRIEQMTVTAYTDESYLRTAVRVTITRDADQRVPHHTGDDNGCGRLNVRMSGDTPQDARDGRTVYTDLAEAKVAAEDWAARLLEAKLATQTPARDLAVLLDGFVTGVPREAVR